MATKPATTEPTVESVTEALRDAWPEWHKHHARCPARSRCRGEHGEWVDVLLEELSDALRRHA